MYGLFKGDSLDSDELDLMCSALDSALQEKNYEQISTLASDIDRSVRYLVESGELDRQSMEALNKRIFALLSQCQSHKKQVLCQSKNLTRGAAGVKAYKKV